MQRAQYTRWWLRYKGRPAEGEGREQRGGVGGVKGGSKGENRGEGLREWWGGAREGTEGRGGGSEGEEGIRRKEDQW